MERGTWEDQKWGGKIWSNGKSEWTQQPTKFDAEQKKMKSMEKVCMTTVDCELPTFPCKRYPLEMMLGGPQNRAGRRGEEKILDPTGTQTPARSQSLYRLRYPGSFEKPWELFLQKQHPALTTELKSAKRRPFWTRTGRCRLLTLKPSAMHSRATRLASRSGLLAVTIFSVTFLCLSRQILRQYVKNRPRQIPLSSSFSVISSCI
jgi:hypothetical protein